VVQKGVEQMLLMAVECALAGNLFDAGVNCALCGVNCALCGVNCGPKGCGADAADGSGVCAGRQPVRRRHGPLGFRV
jgi:hypothetical protein